MFEMPVYVNKDIFFVAFYPLKVWRGAQFILRGKAPSGRKVYLSYQNIDQLAGPKDFTDDYILTTYANKYNSFVFPQISIPEKTELVVWMKLEPSDSLASLSEIFKYWIDYRAKSSISACVIGLLPHEFVENYKEYSLITATASWNPADFYQNGIFILGIDDTFLKDPPERFLSPDSQHNCINNVVYAYNLLRSGQSLNVAAGIALTKTFEKIRNDGYSTQQEFSSRITSSFQAVLFWSYFYDNEFSEMPTLTIEAKNSLGYLNTIVIAKDQEFIYEGNQCDIQTNCNWVFSDYTDTEVRLISTTLTVEELKQTTGFIDVSLITNETEREEACIRNLYLASTKSSLTSNERKLLQATTRVAPYDYVINNSNQTSSQKKNFNTTIIWASFYNDEPPSPILTATLTDMGELKMTGFYIKTYSVINNSNLTYEIGWNPSIYLNNTVYKYGPAFLNVSMPTEIVLPQNTDDCIANLLYAEQAQNSGRAFTEIENYCLEKTFNMMPFSQSGSSFMGESPGPGVDIIFWSIFYNNDEPPSSSKYIRINESTPCLTADTQITMADNSTKLLGEVQIGDLVLGQDGPTRVKEIRVNEPDDFYYVNIFENNIIIKESAPHRFFNVEQGFSQKLKKWKIGEHALTHDGKQVALLQRNKMFGKEKKYGLYTESGTYYANGLLSGPMAINKKLLSTSSIAKVVEMVSSIDANRALKFAKTGEDE